MILISLFLLQLTQTIYPMKERILALLLLKFAGVRKDALALMAGNLDMQVTTEAEAQALIDKITVEKVTEFVKEYRAEVDKEVSTGIKTNETKLKEKFDLVEKKPGATPPATPPAEPPANDLSAQIAAAVSAAMKPLTDQIASINAGKITETRKATLEAKLKDVPENFKAKVLKDFGRMSFQKDEDFDAYLTDTDTDIAALNQELADKGLGQQGRPNFGTPGKDGVSKATQDYLNSAKPDANQFEGKKI